MLGVAAAGSAAWRRSISRSTKSAMPRPCPARGAAEAQWRPMLVDAMAGAASRAGHGLGVADMVLREMLRRQSGETTTDAENTTR